ncbi:12472_t:CDS:2 [Ambispora gerdemannii]|uniref:12472_t:CDS:1 n=1 Tax=Ambispora gerdemannii TaxID=144530 RepID=A0A9N9FR88_9GLOM|nr:12472_t:CDS:2 [Ambispora gerdemannii]
MSLEAFTQTAITSSDPTAETNQQDTSTSTHQQDTSTSTHQQDTSTSTHDQILTNDQDAQLQSPITRVIVIAIDHSSHSQYAFDWATKNLLRKETDLVVLVNVRPITSIPGPYAIGAAYMDFSDVVLNIEEQHRANSHQLLQEYALKLKQQNFACKAIAMRGDARDEIVRKVEEVCADSLVIGSRGLGALKRTILGSVSDYCSHICRCTVIIVKEHENRH